MGVPNATDHRVGDRRGKNLRPAVPAIETARASRSSAPDTGRTPLGASGEPSAAAFGAVADSEIRKAFAAIPRDDFPPRDP
jgi:hypothetical protein